MAVTHRGVSEFTEVPSISGHSFILFSKNTAWRIYACCTPYLLAKLSGWADNHCNGTIPWFKLLLIHDVNQHRPDEGCCFSTSGLSYPNHISATQCNWNTLKIGRFQTQIMPTLAYSYARYDMKTLLTRGKHITEGSQQLMLMLPWFYCKV